MFRIQVRSLPHVACLGRSNALNFGTCGKRIDLTNEHGEDRPHPQQYLNYCAGRYWAARDAAAWR